MNFESYWFVAKTKLKFKGLNLALLVLSLLVLSGSAIFMSGGYKTGFNSGASESEKTITGKLVKSGTAGYKVCKDLTSKYALVEDQGCRALTVTEALAEPLVGKKVNVTGVIESGEFFAVTLSEVSN